MACLLLRTSPIHQPTTNRREKFHQMWQPKYAVFWPLLLPTFGLSLLGVGKKCIQKRPSLSDQESMS